MIHMDKRLQIIAHLYAESDDRAAFRSLLEDDEVREEYQALSEVKFQLDHHRPVRPDPVVVDRLMAALKKRAELPSPPRRDRPAMRLLPRRPWQWVAAAAAIAIVGVGILQILPDQKHTPGVVAKETAGQRAVAPFVGDSVSEFDPNLRTVDAGAKTPAWDDAKDVRQLYRRIERLRAHNKNLLWGEPVVPLEMLPGAQPLADPAIQQAGERRNR